MARITFMRIQVRSLIAICILCLISAITLKASSRCFQLPRLRGISAVALQDKKSFSISRRALGDDADGAEEDTTNVELFRQSLIQGWGAGEVGSTAGAKADWAETVDPAKLQAGDLLLGNPERFFGPASSSSFRRLGMDGLWPDMSRRERQRLLPIVLVTNIQSSTGSVEGLWLTMRTGKLMGDFVDHFHSRPLLYGGPTEASVTMVHPYPEVSGSTPLSDGGLYLGGSFDSAQEWVEEGQGSSLRFRFFVNRIRWSPGELLQELQLTTWLPVKCSSDLILTEADSLDDNPLWVQVAQLVGGELEELGRKHGLLD